MHTWLHMAGAIFPRPPFLFSRVQIRCDLWTRFEHRLCLVFENPKRALLVATAKPWRFWGKHARWVAPILITVNKSLISDGFSQHSYVAFGLLAQFARPFSAEIAGHAKHRRCV